MTTFMAEPTLPYLARRVKELRERAGMTQQQLAGAAGLSMSVVTHIEQGIRPDPRVSTILALAKALGATTDELAREPEAPVSAPDDKPRRRRGGGK